MVEWVYTLCRSLHLLGGKAHYSDIAEMAFKLNEQNNDQKDPKATIRDALQRYSRDSTKGKRQGILEGDAHDVFRFEPQRSSGIYWFSEGDNPIRKYAIGELDKEALRARLESGESSSRKIQKSVLDALDEDDENRKVFVNEHWRKWPSSNSKEPHTLTISHADASPFAPEGLRAFFEYRDLGIDTATQGDIGAQVIRAVPGEASAGAWHSHDLTFQMVYVTKGWVEFEYAGHGKVMMRAGSSVLQPPNIVHRLTRNSDDMELLEITAPAAFETKLEGAPI